MNRREFGKKASIATLGISLLGTSCNIRLKGKKILILGGTNYFGPAIVESLINLNNEITLFNRGITNPDLFDSIEKLRGNRDIEKENLEQLDNNREWDAVIDVWPSDPRMVERTAKLLKNRVKKYIFVSTKVVYANYDEYGITESYPLRKVSDFYVGMPYKESKVICERTVRKHYPENHVIVRPPGTFGKRDESWSFVYWLWRIRSGGKVMAPGDGKDIVSYSSVADIANFMCLALKKDLLGAFNVIGPTANYLTFRELLNSMNDHFGKKAKFVWVAEQFLLEKMELEPIRDIPLWAPRSVSIGFHTMSSKKAIQSGHEFRPMEETMDDAISWYDKVKSAENDPGLDKNRPFNGISRAKELEILSIWEKEKENYVADS